MSPIERNLRKPDMKMVRQSRRTRYVLPEDTKKLMGAKDEPKKKHLKVLVVDDTESYRKNISEIFIDLGHGVMSAENGRKALEIFPVGFDLVILDFNMPGMNGDVVFERLKEIDPDVNVIFCSKGIGKKTLDRLREMGALAFIAKPVSPMEITILIQSMFEDS
jgi:CheY-like chemotaxis protein